MFFLSSACKPINRPCGLIGCANLPFSWKDVMITKFILNGGFFFFFCNFILFFWIRGNLILGKAYFVGPDERVKPRLSQALIRGARPNSNSRPTVQISSPLSSRHASWRLNRYTLTTKLILFNISAVMFLPF